MQFAIFADSDLAGRALYQRGEAFAREPANLDTPNARQAQGPSDVASKRLSRQSGAPWWTSALASAAITQPGFADPGHSNIRMTLAIYTAPQTACKTPPRPRSKKRSLDRLLTKDPGSNAEAFYFSSNCRTF